VFCGQSPQNTPTPTLVMEIPIETSWTKSTPRDEKRTYFQDSPKRGFSIEPGRWYHYSNPW
jgi:hypothetical protein